MNTIAEKTARTKPRAKPLGTAIDAIWDKREKLRELGAQVKALEGEIKDQELELIERLEKEGLDSARGTKATISVTKPIVANVTDWEKFWAYIHKNKITHLLQRRVSDPAYRELLEMGKKVPGVEPFTKTNLSVRSL